MQRAVCPLTRKQVPHQVSRVKRERKTLYPWGDGVFHTFFLYHQTYKLELDIVADVGKHPN